MPAPVHKAEARRTLSKCKVHDRNFKYFYLEFVESGKEYVDTDTLRNIISNLQKYVAVRISTENEDTLQVLRDKSAKAGIRNKIREKHKRK